MGRCLSEVVIPSTPMNPTAPETVADSKVVVETGNGFGAVNTLVRRFTTLVENVGSDITYADSADNGASFTINVDGLYSLCWVDSRNGGSSAEMLFMKNAITSSGSDPATRLAYVDLGTNAVAYCLSTTRRLSAGDVIRCVRVTGGTFGTTAQFAIQRVA